MIQEFCEGVGCSDLNSKCHINMDSSLTECVHSGKIPVFLNIKR